MKKVISLLLSVVMILSLMSVSVIAAEPAEVTAKVNYTAKTIDVVYKNTANYDCFVTIYMVDADDYDGDVFYGYDEDGSIIRMAVVDAGANSDANATFVLGADIKTGDYNIYAAPSGKYGMDYYAKIETPLSIIGETADEGEQTIASVLEFVNAGTDKNISTRAYARLRSALNLSSNPVWRNAYLFEIKNADFAGNFASIADVDNAIKMADALYAVRNASSDTLATVIANNSDILALDVENADYKNQTYNAMILEAYAAKLKADDVKSRSAAGVAFDESIAFTVFNNGSVAERAATFTKYQNSLGISDALLSLIKDKGAEVVARHMTDFKSEIKSEIVTKITDVLAAIGNEPSNEPVYVPSGNKGGGGSVGGGITIPNDVVIPDPVVVPESNAVFADVAKSHWANEPVEALAKLGVVSGKGNGKFDPESTVTREEFVKMIVGAFGIESKDGVIDFADVPASHWAYEYIRTAYAKNIVKGISWDKFGVGSPITRQDMAVIIMRVVKDKEIELTGNASSFKDDNLIADYAKESVMELVAGGVINGYNDGTFRPEGPLTRAEAAKVIYALMNR